MAIVVGPTTLKVPQHVLTLSDFHILWFVLGIAVMLGLEALKNIRKKCRCIDTQIFRERLT